MEKHQIRGSKEILTAIYRSVHEDQNFFDNKVDGVFPWLF
jgi:hypothetical protein